MWYNSSPFQFHDLKCYVFTQIDDFQECCCDHVTEIIIIVRYQVFKDDVLLL